LRELPQVLALHVAGLQRQRRHGDSSNSSFFTDNKGMQPTK
jgi:hypothetical protein